jgi:hypothetical protein
MFKNTAEPFDPSTRTYSSPASYGFANTPMLLFVWSRLFQSIISQAGTYLLSKKFHDRQCSIYKSEGGCTIDGFGDLVLRNDSCYFDGYHSKTSEKNAAKLSKLITHIVLGWDPNDPVESMLKLASSYIKVTPDQLREAIKISSNGGVFGGNALSSFFGWNPFSKAPIDRDYEKFCLTEISGKPVGEVDQMHADQDLGEKLLEKMDIKIQKATPGTFLYPLCCRPCRQNDGSLHFWINTGRFTQIDGWKTQQEIEEFLKSDGILNDNREKLQ